ncbi:MAG: hypothetical protein ACFFDN_17850 [Candidatus Hodarchaeota archaeon]
MAEETSEKEDEESTPKWLAFWVFGKLSIFGFGWIIGGLLVIILREGLLTLGIIFIFCGLGYISLMILIAIPVKSKIKKKEVRPEEKRPESKDSKRYRFNFFLIILWGIGIFIFLFLVVSLLSKNVVAGLMIALFISVSSMLIAIYVYKEQIKKQKKIR